MATGIIKQPVTPYRETTVSLSIKSTPALLTREGHICCLLSPYDATSVRSGYNNIGTVPSGYRPPQTVRVAVQNTNNGSFVDIRADGLINIYCPSTIAGATNCGFLATWMTAE